MGRASSCTRDRFYVFATLFMVCVTLATIPEFIQTMSARQAKYPNALRFGDMSYAIGFAVLLAAVRRILQRPFAIVGDMVVARKPEWTASYRQKKISRFSEQAYKLIYAVCISACEWYLLQNETFFPRMLGGSGEARRMWTHREPVAPFGFRLVYWVALAYNIEDFLSHSLLVERRSDYNEMIFHHVMAICLIIISYFTNHWRAGLIVLFVHDVPDIFAHGIKCSVDGSNTPRTLSLYFGLLITWGYYRLFVFPKEVIFTSLSSLSVEGVPSMFIMAISLLALHAYWYCSFISMGLAFLKTGKTVDTQQLIIEKKNGKPSPSSSPKSSGSHVKSN